MATRKRGTKPKGASVSPELLDRSGAPLVAPVNSNCAGYRVTKPSTTDEGWINCDGSLFADADRLGNAAIMAGEGVKP